MQDNKPVPSAVSFKESTLPNGLQVFSNCVPHVSSMTVGLWINAGSREDPAGMSGLAHFLEHALFKGTRSRDYLTIARCIEEVGGSINAYTTKENTCISIRCLAENSALAFELLSDLVCNPVFPEDETEKEKEVVIEEIHANDDNPEELIFDQFDSLAFPRHPLGSSILGTEQTVERITTEELQSFMQRYYVSHNMFLVAVGNAPHDEVMRQCEKPFSGLRSNGTSPVDGRTFRKKDYRAFFTRQQKQLCQTQLLSGKAVVRDDRFFYGLLLLNTILSFGMSSVLNLELREKHALAYTAYSSLSFFDDMTMLDVYAGVDPENTARTMTLIDRILKAETFSRISREELAAAKNKLRAGFVMEMEKMTRRMSKAARDILYFGKVIGLEEKLASIEKVTGDDLLRAASYLDMDRDASVLLYEPVEQ